MSRIAIIIDGNTVMDSQVTLRQGELPNLDDIRKTLTPANGTFQPWSATIIGTLGAELLIAKAGGTIPNITITVTTRDTGWTLDVEHAT